MQRDVVVTIDFDDQRKPVDVAREIAALDAGGADRSAVLMEVIAPLSADEEVSVSPDGSAKQDQTHFQEPGSLDD